MNGIAPITPADARLRVPVVDAEGLIGLKLQALVDDPRRIQDEADIRTLLERHGDRLDLELLKDYFELFGREHDPEAWFPKPKDD